MSDKFKWLLFELLAIFVVGCAARPAMLEAPSMPMSEPQDVVVEREYAVASGEDAAQWSKANAGMPGVENVDRKIIYNVSLHLIVKDTSDAFAQIRRLAQEMGGFVSESNVWRDEGHPRASVTVRVPVGKLEDALAEFRALALDVEGESLDSQDVTEEYVDLGARLKNEQRTEAELLELLESRSEMGKTADILEVHRELGQVRGRIEQIQGQMNYLENLSAMATVRIQLTPDVLMQPIDVGGWRPQGTARNAVRMLLRTVQFFGDAAIVFVIYILPTLVLIAIPVAILVVIVRAIWRWIRRRRRGAKQGAQKKVASQ
jgi:hypothetical protein